MKKFMALIGVICTMITMAGCNNVEYSEEELCEQYLAEHNWDEDEYDYYTCEPCETSDEYFLIYIYTNGKDFPTQVGTVRYK